MWALDLGTTNTGVARWSVKEDRPRLVELPEICRQPGGEDHLEAPLLVPTVTHVFDSLSFWGKVGSWPWVARRAFFGKQAFIGRRALEANELRLAPCFARSFKRHLGRAPLRTIARARGRPVSARDVARVFLRELLVEIQETTGERIRDLVVTSPVEAFESYRAELSQILKGLGVRRVRFLDEPVAAAIGYGLTLRSSRVALVVDFGGGTLDCALVVLTARGVEEGRCEVLGKEGRPIGGHQVDRWLLRHFFDRLGYPVPGDLDEDSPSFSTRSLLEETCRVKEGLFFRKSDMFIPSAPDELARFEARIRDNSGTLTVTREDVIEALRQEGLFDALEACIDGVFEQAKGQRVGPEDVEDILMVGGSTLLPGVYPHFEARFGREKVRAWQPFEAVAYGATAYAAGATRQSDFIVHDYAFVTHDIETHEKQYSVIVPHGTRFPTSADFWKRQLVPTCSLGEPETMFKLVICEVARDHGTERHFVWDKNGTLHMLGGTREAGTKEEAGTQEADNDTGAEELIVVPLNESNPTLGYLRPPHPPTDRRPRLEIAFGVNDERWLCATVYDLQTKRYMMREEPVVRLL